VAHVLRIKVENCLWNVVKYGFVVYNLWEKVENVKKWVFEVSERACNEVEVGLISANIKTPERTVSITKGVPDEIEGRGVAGTSACQYGHLLSSICSENVKLSVLWLKVETTPLLDAVCFINN